MPEYSVTVRAIIERCYSVTAVNKKEAKELCESGGPTAENTELVKHLWSTAKITNQFETGE